MVSGSFIEKKGVLSFVGVGTFLFLISDLTVGLIGKYYFEKLFYFFPITPFLTTSDCSNPSFNIKNLP